MPDSSSLLSLCLFLLGVGGCVCGCCFQSLKFFAYKRQRAISEIEFKLVCFKFFSSCEYFHNHSMTHQFKMVYRELGLTFHEVRLLESEKEDCPIKLPHLSIPDFLLMNFAGRASRIQG